MNTIKNNTKYSYKIFIMLMLAVLIIVSGIIGLIYYLEAKNEKNTIIAGEDHLLNMVDGRIQDAFKVVLSDIEMVLEDSERSADDGIFNPELMADGLLAMIRSRKIYDQIRFFDDQGMETTRVNYNNGDPFIVNKDELQFKGDRYYFKETIKLKKGGFFVSPVDLNIEHGRIEQSLKPMVRFGAPVFDNAGGKKGIIVFNYLARDLLASFDKMYSYAQNKIVILNKDGYWLKSEKPENEWGFMYEDRKEINFKKQQPRIWQKIQSGSDNNITTNDGEYIFRTIYPLSFTGLNKDYYWHVVSFVPRGALTAKSKQLLYNLAGVSAVLYLIILIFIWVLAKSISKKRQAERKVAQLYDLLRVINKILRHDIRNRLTPIKLALEAYRNYKDTRGFKMAEEALESGIELINEMRRLEELATAGNGLKLMRVKEVVNEITGQYNIPIEIEGSGRAVADSALGSVFDNIIRNAVVHGQTKKMKITISRTKDYLRVDMADYGKGIPEKIRSKIFQEGFTHGETGGTGLGLYIVKKTIERYGGEIAVKANNPKGTIFIIKLPRA